jgi:hypothetical protein
MHTAKHPLVAAMQTFSWDVVGKTKTTENNHHTRAMYPENNYILQLICNIWMAGRLQPIGIPRKNVYTELQSPCIAKSVL